MPSPKPSQPRTATLSPSRIETTIVTTTAMNSSSISPDALSRPLADLDMDATAASNYPRRRNSLLNGTGGRSTATHTRGPSLVSPSGRIDSSAAAANRIPEDGVGGSNTGRRRGDSDTAGWDDAWGNDGFDEDDVKTGSRDDDEDDDDDDTLTDEDLHDDEEAGLTRKQRLRKARARRERAQLDQRLVPGSPIGSSNNDDDGGFGSGGTLFGAVAAGITADERKEADKNVLRRLAINGSLIGLWYLFSLSLSLYNKWMFGDGKLDFHFPLFTTSIHMLVQFSLSSLVLYVVPSLRPGAHDDDDDDDDGNGNGANKVARPSAKMSKMFYLTRIGPCGAATGLDIGMGNASLIYITLTFYTMCKSSSLAFVLLFAFFFRLETPTWRLVGIIATMTAGVVMMVAGEVEFNVRGFALVIGAAFFSGFRWGLTQILLLRNPATANPFSSIFFLAPVMFLTLFVLAIPMEGLADLPAGFARLADQFGALRAGLLILFPGTIAFLMTASEFALLQRTSVVTLSIAGIFKEVVTIVAASLVFDETLTAINLLGLIITLAAITAYNYIKITKMRRQAQLDVHRGNSRPSSSATHGPGSAPRFADPVEFAFEMSSTSSASATPANSGSDAEVDADSEDAGLLHKHSGSDEPGRRVL